MFIPLPLKRFRMIYYYFVANVLNQFYSITKFNKNTFYATFAKYNIRELGYRGAWILGALRVGEMTNYFFVFSLTLLVHQQLMHLIKGTSHASHKQTKKGDLT